MHRPHAHCTLWVSRGHRFCQKPWFAWLLFHEFGSKSHTIFEQPFQSRCMVNKKPCGLWRMVESMRFVVFQELLELTPPQLHSILERDLWRVPKVSMIIEIQPEVWWLFGEIFYTQVRWRNPMHGLMECPKCCKWESDGQHRYCDMYRIHLSIWLDSFFQMKHYASTLNWPSDKSIKQHSMHSTIYIYIYMDASPKSIAEPFDRW